MTHTQFNRIHITRMRQSLGWEPEDMALALGHKTQWAATLLKYETGEANIPGSHMLAFSLLARTLVSNPDATQYAPSELHTALIHIKGLDEWLDTHTPQTAHTHTSEQKTAPEPTPTPDIQTTPEDKHQPQQVDFTALAAIAQGHTPQEPQSTPQEPQEPQEPQSTPQEPQEPQEPLGHALLPNNLWAWAMQPDVSDEDIDVVKAMHETQRPVWDWMAHPSVSVEQINSYIVQLKTAAAWHA